MRVRASRKCRSYNQHRNFFNTLSSTRYSGLIASFFHSASLQIPLSNRAGRMVPFDCNRDTVSSQLIVIDASTLRMIASAGGEKSRDMNTETIIIRHFSSFIANWQFIIQINFAFFRNRIKINAAMIVNSIMKYDNNHNINEYRRIFHWFEYKSIDDFQNLFLLKMIFIVITNHIDDSSFGHINNRFIIKYHYFRSSYIMYEFFKDLCLYRWVIELQMKFRCYYNDLWVL